MLDIAILLVERPGGLLVNGIKIALMDASVEMR